MRGHARVVPESQGILNKAYQLSACACDLIAACDNGPTFVYAFSPLLDSGTGFHKWAASQSTAPRGGEADPAGEAGALAPE